MARAVKVAVVVHSNLFFFRTWLNFVKVLHALGIFSPEFIWSLALSGRSLVLLKIEAGPDSAKLTRSSGRWFRYRPDH